MTEIFVVTRGAMLRVCEAVLDGELAEFTIPVVRSVKVTSTIAFDLGVFSVVVGLVQMVFEGFGEDAAPGSGTR